ncbi:hypothetical protein OG978_03480 [Streptomyces sp. NBC_01591]|uniref:hypothetical protein n=1 Tax=Streptomyces sp. NBC_01591 TaxID=2975888 RepID=UPI002DD812CC|nr:hypothetical protein [Streptomyces sp. NBC_01591]WSD66525.1 hypothetical protein OG978_03480 [Streptomyces sp. NBC_01591]
MLFVLRYRNGEPEPLDMELVREVLAPYVAAADEDLTNGVLIRTADGYEVDVDINQVCIAVNRFPPGQFFDVLAELVDRLGASVTPTDRPVILREERDRSHLPAGAGADAGVVAMTGSALEYYLSGS